MLFGNKEKNKEENSAQKILVDEYEKQGDIHSIVEIKNVALMSFNNDLLDYADAAFARLEEARHKKEEAQKIEKQRIEKEKKIEEEKERKIVSVEKEKEKIKKIKVKIENFFEDDEKEKRFDVVGARNEYSKTYKKLRKIISPNEDDLKSFKQKWMGEVEEIDYKEKEKIEKLLVSLSQIYDSARVDQGNRMLWLKEVEFAKSNKTPSDVENELRIYKADNVFSKLILDEKRAFIDLEIELLSINHGKIVDNTKNVYKKWANENRKKSLKFTRSMLAGVGASVSAISDVILSISNQDNAAEKIISSQKEIIPTEIITPAVIQQEDSYTEPELLPIVEPVEPAENFIAKIEPVILENNPIEFDNEIAPEKEEEKEEALPVVNVPVKQEFLQKVNIVTKTPQRISVAGRAKDKKSAENIALFNSKVAVSKYDKNINYKDISNIDKKFIPEKDGTMTCIITVLTP